jgi:hypothetical protein
MGMVVRTLYNNQGWRAPCRHPNQDRGCWLCFEDNVAIQPPSRTDEKCSGHCWEQHLCAEYRWGCIPKGATFGRRAYPGTKVFFVFKQPDGNYTLWGETSVRSTDDMPLDQGGDDEAGFAFVHFEPFEPLPRDKWVSNLSNIQLVGQKWLMGRHRYINAEREAYLKELCERGVAERPSPSKAGISLKNDIALNITVMPNVYRRLESIAQDEGRHMDEIIREAIAEWLRRRKNAP